MALHNTAAEHYQKLRRLHQRLQAEVHRDDLDDFFKTAYHLIEIIEKDPKTDGVQKTMATALEFDADLKLCGEITNRQKHYTLNPRHHPDPQVQGASIQEGYDVGRYGAGDYDAGEQSVVLNLADGTSRDALDLVNAVMAKFASIFPGV
jgi:hypothetical protein